MKELENKIGKPVKVISIVPQNDYWTWQKLDGRRIGKYKYKKDCIYENCKDFFEKEIKSKKMADIARECGVSRQRIEQVIKAFGLKKAYKEDHIPLRWFCPKCGKKLKKPAIGYARKVCDDCYKFIRYEKGHVCECCGKKTKPTQRTSGFCFACYQKRRRLGKSKKITKDMILLREKIKKVGRTVISEKLGVSLGWVSLAKLGYFKKIKQEYLDKIKQL